MAGASSAGFSEFMRSLAGERPWRFTWVIVVQSLAGIGQAIGVLLLIPLLGAVGVGARSGLTHSIRSVFTSVGVRPTLIVVLTTYVLVTAASAALNAYQTVLGTRYRLEFVDHLRGRLYGAIAHARWRHLMELRQSDLLAVLTTNVTWVGIGAMGVLSLISVVVVVAAQLAVAAGISAPLTGLAVLSGIGLVLVVWPLIRRSRRLGRELMERNRVVMAMATGFLDALKLAKAYGREDEHVSLFNASLTEARGSQVGFARASAGANAVQLILTAALLAVTVEISVRYLHVPVGSLLVVAFVFTRVVGQVAGSQSSIQQVAQALPSFDEVKKLIASCEGADEHSPRMRGAVRRVGIGGGIRMDQVTFAYPGSGGERELALDDVSLEIPVGSMVALAGPSGAGKTTLADLVVGLISPTAGEVSVGGAPLTGARLLGWRGSVALVPQDPFLFHDTIRANLSWALPGADEAQLWRSLSMSSAEEFVRRLPQGLDAVVGDRGMRLSGGERQRLALARALLREPELLVLDEATSSLDSENERAIRTALDALRGRTTMLVIAHRLATASDADRIVVLDGGRVIESGSWSELARVPHGRLQALVNAGATDHAPDRGASR